MYSSSAEGGNISKEVKWELGFGTGIGTRIEIGAADSRGEGGHIFVGKLLFKKYPDTSSSLINFCFNSFI